MVDIIQARRIFNHMVNKSPERLNAVFHALADPTRREDLERLLAELPSTGSPLHMDAQRLRALLGL